MTKRLLTNAKDVSGCKLELLSLQDSKDLCTGLRLEVKDSCLDHDHSNDLVRGVLHRQVNAYIGKLENNYVRMLRWWYPEDLPFFLRKCADYLELEQEMIYHSGWIKTCTVEFNKLKVGEQNKVLGAFGIKLVKSNLLQRRKALKDLMIKKLVTKGEVLDEIKQAKELD